MEITFTVTFQSGYETEVKLDPADLSSEYWVEFTQRQNPYDLSDEPVAVDGVALDSEGAWMDYVDGKLGISA